MLSAATPLLPLDHATTVVIDYHQHLYNPPAGGNHLGSAPVPGERMALVGARDIERDELTLLKQVGVHGVSVDSHLLQWVKEIARMTTGLYVHFDLDVLDPNEPS